jgi:hypothetical protein
MYISSQSCKSIFETLCVNMVLGKIGWGDMDWSVLAQDRERLIALVNAVMNLRVP